MNCGMSSIEQGRGEMERKCGRGMDEMFHPLIVLACPQTITQLEKVEFLPRVLEALCSQQAAILSSINGTSALCLLGMSMSVVVVCGV